METQITLLRETASVAELAYKAISAVVNGEVDPITAHINISRMEVAIKRFKDNDQVRDITLRELSKYGTSHQFGDCKMEQAEAGVKYDYSSCGDEAYNELLRTRAAMDAGIKEREAYLKAIPVSGVQTFNDQTGEVITIYPPAKSSKTILKTTFKKS